MIATGLGCLAGTLITGALTAGTAGVGAIPGIIVGLGAGTVVSVGVTKSATWRENKIWGESK